MAAAVLPASRRLRATGRGSWSKPRKWARRCCASRTAIRTNGIRDGTDIGRDRRIFRRQFVDTQIRNPNEPTGGVRLEREQRANVVGSELISHTSIIRRRLAIRYLE